MCIIMKSNNNYRTKQGAAVATPEGETCYDMAELFKIFGDTTRVKILFTLFKQELCVTDLALAVGMTQSAVSHQLRLMRHFNLALARRKGRLSYYSMGVNHVKKIFSLAMELIRE